MDKPTTNLKNRPRRKKKSAKTSYLPEPAKTQKNLNGSNKTLMVQTWHSKITINDVSVTKYEVESSLLDESSRISSLLFLLCEQRVHDSDHFTLSWLSIFSIATSKYLKKSPIIILV